MVLGGRTAWDAGSQEQAPYPCPCFFVEAGDETTSENLRLALATLMDHFMLGCKMSNGVNCLQGKHLTYTGLSFQP